MGSNPHFLLRPDPSARHFSQPPAENRSTHIYTRLPPSHTPTALRPRALWGCGKHPSALARRPPRGIYRAETPRRGEPKFSSPTPTALCHTARGCAAEALPRVQATSRSLPRKGLCRSCPPGGVGNKGGMKSCSRVRKRSPPGMYVPYPRHTHTSHTIHVHSRSPPQRQGRCAIQPGVAPPRRYPGSRPHRVPYPARGCAVRARRGVWETRAE